MSEAITREEKYLSGSADGLTPVTRKEKFLAAMSGMDVVPPAPITREEYFLQKAIDNAGGGSGGGDAGGEGWIGDGNTHIWITLSEGRTSPMLGIGVNGTVTVDWGDGTTPDVLTGTSISSVKWTPTHEYAKPGDYVITLTVDGEAAFMGEQSENTYARALRFSAAADTRNNAYRLAITRAEIGNGVSLSNNAFRFCTSLKDVLMTAGFSYLNNYAFFACDHIKSVTIPDGTENIGSFAFSQCSSLYSVIVPASVSTIAMAAFDYCYIARFYDFSKHTVVPTLSNANAFSNIPIDCEIRVPAALYDEWIAATNWTTYASNIVAV